MKKLTTSMGLRASALAAALALSLSACQDGFFHDPASIVAVPVTVSYSLAAGAAAVGPGDAFDRADMAHVRLTLGGVIAHEEMVPLQVGSQDKEINLELDLESGQASGVLDVQLSAQNDPIFNGSTSVTLTPGQAAQVDVPLTPIEVGLIVNGSTTPLRLGRTRQLSAISLFATGDQVGTVNATWTALSSNVTVSSSGLVTTLSNGLAQVRANYSGLAAVTSFNVLDPCLSQPSSITIGQTVSGSLSRDEDCLTSTGSNRLFDPYVLSLGSQTTFAATMSSDPFHPFLPMSDANGQQRAGPTTTTSQSVSREFVLAPGNWEFRTTSNETAGGLDQAAEGTYTLSLTPLGAVQEGCGRETVLSYGANASGTVTTSDCPDEFDNDPNIDRFWDGFTWFGVAGETATFEAVANFPFRLTHWAGGNFVEGGFNVPAGDPAYITGTVSQSGFSSFFVINENHQQGGSYAVSLRLGGPTPAPNLVVARATFPASANQGGPFAVTADIGNAGGALGGQSFDVDVYIAVNPNLSGPNALLGHLFGSGPIANANEISLQGTLNVPIGPSGPHYVIFVVDPGNVISESGEQNTFVMGTTTIN